MKKVNADEKTSLAMQIYCYLKKRRGETVNKSEIAEKVGRLKTVKIDGGREVKKPTSTFSHTLAEMKMQQEKALAPWKKFLGDEIDFKHHHSLCLTNPMDLSEEEIRFLFDCVYDSKSMTKEQKEKIREKIKFLLPAEKMHWMNSVAVFQNSYEIQSDMLSGILTQLQKEIVEKNPIRLHYGRIVYDRLSNAASLNVKKDDRYLVLPFQIVFLDGRYFLFARTKEEGNPVKVFRVDKIKKISSADPYAFKGVSCSEFTRERCNDIKVEGQTHTPFDKSVEAEFLVKEDEIERVFDVFGTKDIRVSDNRDGLGRVRVKLCAGAGEMDVIRFALDNIGVVEVDGPRELRTKICQRILCGRDCYLTRDNDFYYMIVEKLKAEEDISQACMDFENINLTKINDATYQKFDVQTINLRETSITDISWVRQKKNLRIFKTFEDSIVDYIPLSETDVQDIRIRFPKNGLKSLDFVEKCPCLRSLELGGVRNVEDPSALYRAISPTLEYLKVWGASNIDIEKFKTANPHTKVIIDRHEAEDKQNEISIIDTRKKYDQYPFPLNLLMQISRRRFSDLPMEVLNDALKKAFPDKQVLKDFCEHMLARDKKNILRSLFEDGKCIAEVARKSGLTIAQVDKTMRFVFPSKRYKEYDDFLRICDDILKSKLEDDMDDNAEDAGEYFKNLMQKWNLESKRAKF